VTADVNASQMRGFTPETTRVLLAAVCRQAGLDPSDAELRRYQSNAVYLLGTMPVIVKVARPDDDAEQIQRTVQLARWLMGSGFPTVPLLDIEQPVIADGAIATFWRYLAQTRPIEAGDIASPLRCLHDLPIPAIEVPRLDAIAAIRRSLSKHRILSPDEHANPAQRR
jgi:hypothetical protein